MAGVHALLRCTRCHATARDSRHPPRSYHRRRGPRHAEHGHRRLPAQTPTHHITQEVGIRLDRHGVRGLLATRAPKLERRERAVRVKSLSIQTQRLCPGRTPPLLSVQATRPLLHPPRMPSCLPVSSSRTPLPLPHPSFLSPIPRTRTLLPQQQHPHIVIGALLLARTLTDGEHRADPLLRSRGPSLEHTAPASAAQMAAKTGLCRMMPGADTR